jgi:hypothetical protein
VTRGFLGSLPMVSRAVRPAAAWGWLPGLRWFCSAALLLLLLVLLRTRTRGEEGVASAHSVAVVFVASFFCGCDGGNGGIGMYVESLGCLLLLLLLLLLHRLLTSMCNFLPPKVFWIRPKMVVDCSSRM